jgi:hypothetical protein
MSSSIGPSTVEVSSGRGDDGDGKAVASDFGRFRSGETLMVWVLVCWRRRVNAVNCWLWTSILVRNSADGLSAWTMSFVASILASRWSMRSTIL